jgi:nitrite reductase (NADH) small subunit
MDAPVTGVPMVLIGTVDALRKKVLTAVSIEGVALVVIRSQDGLKVIENRCPHQQTDILHEGTVESNGLTCPLHGRTFDLSDGSCRNGAGRLTFLPTAERDGQLWSALPSLPNFSRF